MSFKAKIICDGAGCTNEHVLKAQHPDDATAEFWQDMPCGWGYTDEDEDDECMLNYCPACLAKLAEIEEGYNASTPEN